MESKEEASTAAGRRSLNRKRARYSLDSSASSPTMAVNTNSSRRKIRRIKSPTNPVNSVTKKKAQITRLLPRSRASQIKTPDSSTNLLSKSKEVPASVIPCKTTTTPFVSPISSNHSPTGEENCENFEPIPNHSQSASPLKSPMRAMLRQLKSDLSPKFVSPSPPSSSTKCSRYGRTQKTKEPMDFFDTNLALAVRRSISDKRTSPKDTDSTVSRQSRQQSRPKKDTTKTNDDSTYNVDLIRSPNNDRSRYLSPIEKLIEINKIAKDQTNSQRNSPNTLGEDYVKLPRTMTSLSPKYLARQIDFDQTIVPKPHTLDPDPKRDPPVIRHSPALAKKSINSPRRPHIPPPPLFSESEPITPSRKNNSDTHLQHKLPDNDLARNCFSSFVTVEKMDIFHADITKLPSSDSTEPKIRKIQTNLPSQTKSSKSLVDDIKPITSTTFANPICSPNKLSPSEGSSSGTTMSEPSSPNLRSDHLETNIDDSASVNLLRKTVAPDKSPRDKMKLSLRKVTNPTNNIIKPTLPIHQDNHQVKNESSSLCVMDKTETPMKDESTQNKLSPCKMPSPKSTKTKTNSPELQNDISEYQPETTTPVKCSPNIKNIALLPKEYTQIAVDTTNSSPLKVMSPAVKSPSNQTKLSLRPKLYNTNPTSPLQIPSPNSHKIASTSKVRQANLTKYFIHLPNKITIPGPPHITKDTLRDEAISKNITHISEQMMTSPNTTNPHSQPDVFKKPSPKSIRKRPSLSKSPRLHTQPSQSPKLDTASSTEVTDNNGVIISSLELPSQHTLKTYKNRRRLLSDVAFDLEGNKDDSVPHENNELTETDTPSDAVVLECSPSEESTQYNLVESLVNIKSDPDFGFNTSIPDDDIPLQCEIELITEGFDVVPVVAVDIKSETDVQLPLSTDIVIKSEIDEPALNKSFEADNSPSVSSADSAKGSSIVDDDPTGSSGTSDSWQEGQLAWARIGNYPYWPCIICSSPEGTYLSFSAGKKPQQRVHVRFLADNGRRCWATASCMMTFRSIEDFENLKRQLPPNLKAKDPRARAFTVSEANLILWHQAVVEGQLLGTFPINRRVQVFERLLNDESLPNKPLISLKRHSVASHDSFDSLFTDVDRRITSTPSILSSRRSSIQEIESIASDNFKEVEPLSRSPTPESPMYEELSFDKGHAEVNDTENIQNFLLSLSSNAEPPSSPVPDQQPDDFHSRLKFDEHIQDMDDDNFRDFYKHTKANFLSESDSRNESHLKHLAHKMWMLKQLKVAKKKPTAKRSIAMRKEDAEKPSSGHKEQPKKRKLDTKITPKKESSNSARRSIRMSISSFKTRKSGEELSLKIKTEPELDNMELLAEKAAKKAQRAEEKEKRELNEISKYFMKEYPKNLLFKGLDKELVCRYCHQVGNLVKCHTSSCHEHVHHLCATNPTWALEQSGPKKSRKSLKSTKTSVQSHVTGDDEVIVVEPIQTLLTDLPNTSGPAYCPDCAINSKPVCYVCKNDNGTVLRCTDKSCGRQFHVACMRYWPQNKINHQNNASQQLLCPCHVCHTCISDDPRGKHYHISSSKLTKCVKCPATYHIDSCCIPAGSILLTATQLICPRHRVESRKPVNANWCFICSTGGQLVCCETCPTSFHAECLKVDVSESCYICEECETGRFPLYGEIVWAKIGSCRWWPAVIVPPTEIPDTVMAVKREPHNFAIRFFGSRDYSWISRGFVFLYQEGDSEYTEIGESRPDRVYQKALLEAKDYALKLQAINEQNINPDKERNLKPLPYTKITRNRPIPPVKLNEEVDEDGDKVCECTDKDEDPCGPNSICMNRMLFFECDPAHCKAGAKCQNQRFEKRQYPNMVERRIEGKGWGLVTLETIPAGAFIIEYVGELINQKEFERRIHEMQQTKDEHYYFLTLTRELIIDAGPRGNSSRFINHSCEPNCETQCWQVKGNTRVGLFALDDIPANTELTFNYNLECIGELKKICHCGAKRCAGFIGAKYVDPDDGPKTVKKEKSKKKNGSRTQKPLPKNTTAKKNASKSTLIEKKRMSLQANGT